MPLEDDLQREQVRNPQDYLQQSLFFFCMGAWDCVPLTPPFLYGKHSQIKLRDQNLSPALPGTMEHCQYCSSL